MEKVTVIVPTLEGVTTALIAFIFVCVVYPTIVKNKTQFYASFVAMLIVILLHSFNLMFGRESPGFQVFAGVMTGLLQVGALVLLFMSAGGITLRELTGDLARAYEVMRRGENEKTVIVPLTGEMPKPRKTVDDDIASAEAEIDKIDLPPQTGWPKKSDNSSSLPLE